MKVPIRIDPRLQRAIDELLFEQGGFEALDLLLALGLLVYNDYEDWCAGSLPYLEQRLQGPAPDDLLQQADLYARELGLVPEPRTYSGWGETAGPGGPALRFSRDPDQQRLFEQRYRRADDLPQLDLFMDAADQAVVNGVIEALGARNLREAARQLQRARLLVPERPELPDLEQLLEGARAAREPCLDPLAELADLEHRMVPLAEHRLGPYARHYLPPLWRRLAEALDGRRYDPAYPERHASYAALRAEDWRRLVDLVEQEPDWRRDAVLLRRHARACGRLRREAECLWSWFLLCWGWPSQAERFELEAEPAWRPSWEAFQDLEPELEGQDFPAWLLLRNPALVKTLRDEPPPNRADGFAELQWLLRLPPGRPSPEMIAARGALKSAHPTLFEHYLNGLRPSR